jgi:hypothetical protein
VSSAATIPIVLTTGFTTTDGTYFYVDCTNSTLSGATTDTFEVIGAPLTMDIAVVGGGGGGSRTYSVGSAKHSSGFYFIEIRTSICGGGGGIRYVENLTLNPGVYNMSVGGGGNGSFGSSNNKGKDSTALNGAIVARGGGAGVANFSSANHVGGSNGAALGGTQSPVNAGSSTYGGTSYGNIGGRWSSVSNNCSSRITNDNYCQGFTYCFDIGPRGGSSTSAGPDIAQTGVACGDAAINVASYAPYSTGVSLLGLTDIAGAGGATSPLNSGRGGVFTGGSGVVRIRYSRSQVGL